METTLFIVLLGSIVALLSTLSMLWIKTRDHPAPNIKIGWPLMPETERAEAYRAAPDTALWRATLADLDQAWLEWGDRALDEDLPEAKVRFALGGQAALGELRVQFERREAEARKREPTPR